MADVMVVDSGAAATLSSSDSLKNSKRVRFVEEITYIEHVEGDYSDEEEDGAFSGLSAFSSSSMLGGLASSLGSGGSGGGKKTATTMDLLDAFLTSAREAAEEEAELDSDEDDEPQRVFGANAPASRVAESDAILSEATSSAPFELSDAPESFTERSRAAFKGLDSSVVVGSVEALRINTAVTAAATAGEGASSESADTLSVAESPDLGKLRETIGIDQDAIPDDIPAPKSKLKARDSLSLKKLRNMAAKYYKKKTGSPSASPSASSSASPASSPLASPNVSMSTLEEPASSSTQPK